MFELGDFVNNLLVVTVEEVAHIEDDVDFVGAAFDSKCNLGHLDLDERLRRGEAAAYAAYVNFADVEDGTYNLCKVGINADGGHAGQIGIFLFKLVDLLGKVGNACGRVGALEGGQVDCAKQELMHTVVVVLLVVFGQDFLYGGVDFGVAGGDF